MSQSSAEELRISHKVQKLKEKISRVGRWHLKRRKADSTRIWKMLFNDMESLLEEQHPFLKGTFISLIVYPRDHKYLIQVHKTHCSSFHGLVANRQKDCNVVISELNSVLIHYDLALVETPESQKRNSKHTINGHREYELKFVQTTE